ncbi:adenosylcobinamide-phosphate synthase CbiB [Spirulina sp. CS-785/01]|uniref:adenosylcobinamide-phosphate synthase CbiB n=1 Tax=Spirulina sp. CS-785/01 TaxID=3021716 RepID=UPI00232E5F36|nr:adenosylcobinamide-phosphate synthase CbiB [Spirulina sp. CS-785/01]MDB9313581.1 adenosylcobinamide-phosphate synthase CbiB [Spirulina sp. CS-785/01]
MLTVPPFNSLAILLLAALGDYIIGDPWHLPHPVQVMGWMIEKLSSLFLKSCQTPLQKKAAGVFLGLFLILGSGIVGYGLSQLATAIHISFGWGVQAILLASCFAGRSLRDAATDVLQPLQNGNIEIAREKLSLYVGRDTANLSQEEILRAVLETIAENTVDGVTAPLLYAILGALIPGVGPVPLALGYKAASTLDSMIGYKREPYLDLGWFSAKFEDILTWWPCRLTVGAIALLSRQPYHVLRLCRRDAPQDPSPNSGWSECAYAAALRVQVGGVNTYQGVLKEKPLLGDNQHPITVETIQQALQLMRGSFLGFVVGYLLLVVGLQWVRTYLDMPWVETQG